MLHLHDVYVTASPSNFFHVYENRYLLCNDTLSVYQLDSRLIDVLEGDLKGKVNGINVMHIPIECGVSEYKKNCAELIKYIIFHQQNDIVKDNLIFANPHIEFHNAAIEACNENQRKITKTEYELFPKPDKSCFNVGLTGYTFTIGYKDDFARSWFGDFGKYTHTTKEEIMPEGVDCIEEEPYASDGWEYQKIDKEPIEEDDGTTTEPPVQYKRVYIHEQYSFPLKQYYSQNMGTFASAVQEGTGNISIEHDVRPDEYMVISN